MTKFWNLDALCLQLNPKFLYALVELGTFIPCSHHPVAFIPSSVSVSVSVCLSVCLSHSGDDR
jgi:hypothetical protein